MTYKELRNTHRNVTIRSSIGHDVRQTGWINITLLPVTPTGTFKRDKPIHLSVPIYERYMDTRKIPQYMEEITSGLCYTDLHITLDISDTPIGEVLSMFIPPLAYQEDHTFEIVLRLTKILSRRSQHP